MNRRVSTIFTLRPAALALIAALLLAAGCGETPLDSTHVDEGRILFIRGTPSATEICTMMPDGSDIQVISRYEWGDGTRWESYKFVSWSPDKNQIVVAGRPGSTRDSWSLWIMDMDGTFLKKLTWRSYKPFWSLDGKDIIFSRLRAGGGAKDIYTISVSTLVEDTLLRAEIDIGAGTGYRYLLYGVLPHAESNLLLNETYFHPDSSGRITDDNKNIIIYNYLSRAKTYLIDNEVGRSSPKVSPNGKLLAYVQQVPDAPYPGTAYLSNLYLTSAEDNSVQQLTAGSKYQYIYLSWSPNGEQLAFYRKDNSQGSTRYGEICRLNIQSGVIETLTNTAQDSIWYIVAEWK